MMEEIKSNSKNIGVIILAAGASSRMGSPKQLLMYAGKTLLQHSIQAALGSMARPVIVVLGAHEDAIKTNLENGNVQVVVNAAWQEGLASSIRYGINALVDTAPFTAATVLMVCDQPNVTALLLNDLIKTQQASSKPIVASSYNGILGVPALFHQSIFPELLKLKGDVGARFIIQEHIHETETIAFSKGNIDIDTETDYRQLYKDNYKA